MMIRTILKDLPSGVHGFTLLDTEGDYTVFLNARQTWEMNMKTYKHEVQHIKGNDHQKTLSADILEQIRHEE